MTKNLLPPIEFVARLRELCGKADTGKLLVTTAASQFATFDVVEGRITSISFGVKRDAEALRLIATAQISETSFVPNAQSSNASKAFADNETIFRRLIEDAPHGLSAGNSSQAPGVKSSRRTLSDADRVVLENTLSSFVGPIANFICKQVFSSCRDLETAVDAIVKKIPDASKAQDFKRQIRDKLS